MTFIYGILSYVRQFCGLIFPLFRQAADFTKWGRWAWYVLHFALIGGIVFGLAYLNSERVPSVYKWHERHLVHKAAWLTPYFLPSLFLLTYALAWILRWIWLQLGPDAEIDEFPDITDAFRAGLDRLSTKGLRLADLPLFLILGRSRAGEEALFQAGQVPIEVFGPVRGEPPVRLWASRDAIFVTAPGASALGKYADILQHGPGDDMDAGNSDAAKKTLGLGDDESLDATVQEINALRALARTRELTAEEKARMRELATTAQQKPQAGRVALTADLAKEASQRLQYLCKLIGRERRPFCPVNGIIALVPWQALEGDDPVKSAALAARTDLASARNGLRQCAPALGLVCDLEETRGFSEFRSAFSAENLAARIGQRFPLVPDQAINEQPALYDSGANWLAERLFPGRVYQALQLDVRDARSLVARNLFHLFRQVHERLPRLGRLLRTGLPLPTGGPDGLDGPLLFAGCYLAGTGRDPNHQAFTPGVFDRLTENQGIVAWTPGALDDDARYRRSANIGIAVVAVVAVGLLIAIWGLWKM